MLITQTAAVSIERQRLILGLWNHEYPLSLRKDEEGIRSYLLSRENPMHFFLADGHGEEVGWSVIFDRDGERWFALLLATSVQGKGYGTRMLNRMKTHEPVLSCWVVDRPGNLKADGTTYLSPLHFYVKNGFTAIPEYDWKPWRCPALK